MTSVPPWVGKLEPMRLQYIGRSATMPMQFGVAFVLIVIMVETEAAGAWPGWMLRSVLTD